MTKFDGIIRVLIAQKIKTKLDIQVAGRKIPKLSVCGRRFFEALAAGDETALAIAMTDQTEKK